MKPTVSIYSYETREGVIEIVGRPAGGFDVRIEGEILGYYHSAEQALDDIVGDHLGSTPFDTGLDQLGIPDELSEWNKRMLAVARI
ncbi:hypothetical protein K3555_12795 [Leisingera sp. M527]|uniref:hypothetical protein n=1 Tax=unclassified Leisingera TaxID=2614906 RepID=UPI0021A8F8EE|nr:MULTISPECIES: hypothetical protein [unclassified Leisingera]UWQ31480.1 hypothetical protein K3555_12795 [Leisingera sp. M527]UWQ73473.1 hypothetical protein K3724_12995 [Leisingera sp. M658]